MYSQCDLSGIEYSSTIFDPGRLKIWPGLSKRIDEKSENSEVKGFSIVLFVANDNGEHQQSNVHERKCFLRLAVA